MSISGAKGLIYLFLFSLSICQSILSFVLLFSLSLTYIFSSLFLPRHYPYFFLVCTLLFFSIISASLFLLVLSFSFLPSLGHNVKLHPHKKSFKIVSHLFRGFPSVEMSIANQIFYTTYISRIHMEILCLLHVCLCSINNYSYDNMRHSGILTLPEISYDDIDVFHCTFL